MNLINQVQFLNVLGRVGGSNTSTSLQVFTEGMGWANLELPPDAAASVFPWRYSNAFSTQPSARRTPKKAKSSNDEGGAVNSSLTSSEEEPACSFTRLVPSVEKLLSCGYLMASVCLLRNLAYYCIKYGFKATPSATFWFPGWEGPVFLVQYLALCEAVISAAVLVCDWQKAVGESLSDNSM